MKRHSRSGRYEHGGAEGFERLKLVVNYVIAENARRLNGGFRNRKIYGDAVLRLWASDVGCAGKDPNSPLRETVFGLLIPAGVLTRKKKKNACRLERKPGRNWNRQHYYGGTGSPGTAVICLLMNYFGSRASC